jgi:hypothetical protein
MDSSKQDSIGLKNYEWDLALGTLFKVKLISVFSLGRTVSFLPMLMTALSLARTWLLLTWSSPCSKVKVKNFISLIKAAGKYLGLFIWDIDSNTFEMSQPFLIQHVLDFLSLDEGKTKSIETPVGKPLLNQDLNRVAQKHTWLYQGAVGMLSYLSNCVHPEIQMAVHQTAQFCINLMQSHELAIMRIRQYLVNPKRGNIYKIDKSKGLEVNVDADFAFSWSAADSENAENVTSRTGFVICHANCPIFGAASSEAEYIAMTHALCETIPIQNLIKEIHCIFSMPNPMTDFCITVHEDNLSAITMVESLKFSSHTKHIAIKYHYFCSRVKTSFNLSRDIKIKYISTKK